MDKINRLLCNYIDCGFEKFPTIDERDLNYYPEELDVKEKNTIFIKKIGYEGLNEEEKEAKGLDHNIKTNKKKRII